MKSDLNRRQMSLRVAICKPEQKAYALDKATLHRNIFSEDIVIQTFWSQGVAVTLN